MAVGDRLQILPDHLCVLSNLHDEVAVSRGGGLVDMWRVAGRGGEKHGSRSRTGFRRTEWWWRQSDGNNSPVMVAPKVHF